MTLQWMNAKYAAIRQRVNRGDRIMTEAAGEWPGGWATVIDLAPDPMAPDIVFLVRHETAHDPKDNSRLWEMGVFENESVWIPQGETNEYPGLRPATRLYGYGYFGIKPASEYARNCVAVVGKWPRHQQCQRKRGHGPEELWCKQHAKKAQEIVDLQSRKKESHNG